MNAFCPNLSNDKIRLEFSELTQAVGKNIAYFLWDKNNGYSLDKAPNGAVSKLFSDLMDNYSGNKIKAIISKAKAFTGKFIERFGDWIVGKQILKDSVDENGEPKMEYIVPKIEIIHQKGEIPQLLSPVQFNKIFGNSTDTNSNVILNNILNDKLIPQSEYELYKILSQYDVLVKRNVEQDEPMLTHLFENGELVITINPNIISGFSNEYASRMFAHEVIHAITVLELKNNNSELANYTQKIFDVYKKAFDSVEYDITDSSRQLYGLLDINEFVAEFMTNSSFRELLFLKAVSLDNENKVGKNKSLLSKFINSIINFFCGNKNSNKRYLLEYREYLYKYVTGLDRTRNNKIKTSDKMKEILKSVDFNVLLNEKISDTQKAFNKDLKILQSYAYSMGEHSPILKDREKVLNDISKEIADMLNVRIKSVRVSNLPQEEKTKTIQGLLALNLALQSEIMDRITSVSYFVKILIPDILEESKKVQKAINNIIKNGQSTFSDSDYMYEMHDFFGVYSNALNKLNSFLISPSSKEFIENQKSINFNGYDDFLQQIQICRNLCDNAINMLQQICQHNIVARLHDIGVETGNADDMLSYIDTWMKDTVEIGENGMSAFNTILGSADKSSDGIVRSIGYLISKADSLALRQTTDTILPLLELQDELKFSHSAYDLYEKDDSGLPTGNLVRKRNYGKFQKDLREFMRKLNAKYSTPEEPLDPNNHLPPKNREVRLKWQQERNQWLGAHCHRRFTTEYYEKFTMLSAETFLARLEIQQQITQIKLKVWIEDRKFYDYDRLTSEDYARLLDLNSQKRQLASIYDINGNEKEEGTVERIIADELLQLNKSLYDGNKAVYDVATWTAERNKIILECGGLKEMQKGRLDENSKFNWKRLDQWDSRNSKFQLKSSEDGGLLLFEDISNEKLKIAEKYGVILDYGEQYLKNKDAINVMLSPYRNYNTGFVITDILSVQKQQKIIKLQKENSKIAKLAIKNLKYKNGKLVPSKEKKLIQKELREAFNKYAKSEYAPEFLDMLNKARRLDIDAEHNGLLGTNVANFMATHGNVMYDFIGSTPVPVGFRPYTFYTKVVPLNFDKYVDVMPGDNFVQQDDNSSFLDENFDETENEAYVPKLYGEYNGLKFSYDNSKAYDHIMKNKDLKNLYDGTLNLLKEVKSIYTNMPFMSEYKLPGISGNAMMQIRGKKLEGSFSRLLHQCTKWYKLDEKDTDYNKIAATRPDGRDLSFIPLPFTAQLDDPATISSDLISIMHMYYLKAQQYKEKTKIKDTCEAMLDLLEKRTQVGKKNLISGQKTQFYKLAKLTINQNLYEMRNTNIEIGNINVGAIVQSWRKTSSANNLGWSPKVSVVGLLTSLNAHIINAIVGKKYGIKLTSIAFMEVLYSIISSGLGNRIISNNSRLFLQNLNEEFNISDQASRKYKNTNTNKYVGAFIRNWCYGMLTVSDYLIKSLILDSTLLSHRYYDGEFLNKEDIVYRCTENGKFNVEKYDSVLKKWKEGKTLYAVMREGHNKDKNKLFTIPDFYKNAYEKSYNKVRRRAEKYAASADGAMTEQLRCAFCCTWYGSLIMMHRQYLPLMINERLMPQVWDMDTQSYNYGVFSSMWRLIMGPLKDAYNAYTALKETDANKILKLKTFKKTYTSSFKERYKNPINRWALKLVLAEISIYNAITIPMVSLMLHAANDPDNDDDYLFQLFAYIAVAYLWESFTPYRVTDAFNNIKTVTAATSLTDAVDNLFFSFNSYKTPENSLWFLFKNVKSVAEDEKDEDNYVKSGVYKGLTKQERALIKLIPMHNLYEQLYGSEAKRRYFEKQVMKQ